MAGFSRMSGEVTGLVFGALIAVAIKPVFASPPLQSDQGQAKIIAPTTSALVAGIIQISGTAFDPSFFQYELDYAADPPTGADAWRPIQPPIAQQVQDGVLAAWDTEQVTNGAYWIRLRVQRLDGTALEDRVEVHVINATATPVATQTLIPSTVTPTPSPTYGPSPTSPIWQPPTRTPRPTMTPGGPIPTSRTFAPNDSPFRPESLQQAAWNGVLFSLGAFAIFAIYEVIRAAIRRELRTSWRQFQTDFIHPVLSALTRRNRKG
jgi:hypothetical protein